MILKAITTRRDMLIKLNCHLLKTDGFISRLKTTKVLSSPALPRGRVQKVLLSGKDLRWNDNDLHQSNTKFFPIYTFSKPNINMDIKSSAIAIPIFRAKNWGFVFTIFQQRTIVCAPSLLITTRFILFI